MLTRRSLLRTGAVGLAALAGCQGSVGGYTRHRVLLDHAAAVPETAGVDIAVTQRGELITDDRTVGFEVTTTNRERPKQLSVEAGPRCCLFAREDGGSRPGGLWLYHVDDRPETRKEGEWSADRDSDEPRAFGAEGCPPSRYEPGESVTNEYRLWADYRFEGYIPPGAYRFETDVSVNTVDGETVASFPWGFGLTIQRVRDPE